MKKLYVHICLRLISPIDFSAFIITMQCVAAFPECSNETCLRYNNRSRRKQQYMNIAEEESWQNPPRRKKALAMLVTTGKKPDVLHSRRSNSLFDCAVRGLRSRCRCEIMREKMAFAKTLQYY